MTEIIFKNRMTQESPNIIKQLKSLWIDMNLDKKQTQNIAQAKRSYGRQRNQG